MVLQEVSNFGHSQRNGRQQGIISVPKALACFHSENTYEEFSNLCKDSSTDT